MKSKTAVDLIRNSYPAGTRLRLIKMNDPYPVPPGTLGMVKHVDDLGQIHMNWDNGRTLALNYEVDYFTRFDKNDELLT